MWSPGISLKTRGARAAARASPLLVESPITPLESVDIIRDDPYARVGRAFLSVA